MDSGAKKRLATALRPPRTPRLTPLKVAPITLEELEDDYHRTSQSEIEGFSRRPTPAPMGAVSARPRRRSGSTAKFPPVERAAPKAREGAAPQSRRKLAGAAWCETAETEEDSVLKASVRALAESPDPAKK